MHDEKQLIEIPVLAIAKIGSQKGLRKDSGHSRELSALLKFALHQIPQILIDNFQISIFRKHFLRAIEQTSTL